jgi:hypothetical protein
MAAREILAVAFFFLAIYAFSGGVLLGVLGYPDWKLIGAEEFPGFHRSYFKRTSILYVPFVFLSVVVNIALIWFHPRAISTPWIVITAALQVFIFAVTSMMFIPIHMKLNDAKSAELIDTIVKYHLYLRMIPGVLTMICTIVMLHQVVGGSSS